MTRSTLSSTARLILVALSLVAFSPNVDALDVWEHAFDSEHQGYLFAVPRGDVNFDGSVSEADARVLANWLYGNGPELPCAQTCDVDGDGAVDLRDVDAILALTQDPSAGQPDSLIIFVTPRLQVDDGWPDPFVDGVIGPGIGIGIVEGTLWLFVLAYGDSGDGASDSVASRGPLGWYHPHKHGATFQQIYLQPDLFVMSPQESSLGWYHPHKHGASLMSPQEDSNESHVRVINGQLHLTCPEGDDYVVDLPGEA